jgi:hypothetical protein
MAFSSPTVASSSTWPWLQRCSRRSRRRRLWSLDSAIVGLAGTAWALATLGVGVAGGVAAVIGGRSYHKPAHHGPGARTPA